MHASSRDKGPKSERKAKGKQKRRLLLAAGGTVAMESNNVPPVGLAHLHLYGIPRPDFQAVKVPAAPRSVPHVVGRRLSSSTLCRTLRRAIRRRSLLPRNVPACHERSGRR